MRNLLIFIRGCAICPCTLALIKESNGWKIFFATTNNDLREVYRALQKKLFDMGPFRMFSKDLELSKNDECLTITILAHRKLFLFYPLIKIVDQMWMRKNLPIIELPRIFLSRPFIGRFFFIPGNILPRSTCLKLCQSVISIVERSWLKWFLVIKQEKTITQMENFQIHFFFSLRLTTVNFKLTLLKT